MRFRFVSSVFCMGVMAVALIGFGDGPARGMTGTAPPLTEHHHPVFGATDILSISAFAFEAYSQVANTTLSVNGSQRYCDGSSCYLEAPVELPDGSIISRIELDAFDDDPSYGVTADLLRCQVGNVGCDWLGGVSTAGTPGNTQVGADLAVPEIIYNQGNSYIVQVHLGNSTDARLNSARLVFQPASSPPPVQSMSINAYAFDPYSIGGRAAINADVARRWCDGFSCLAVAPVDLPSGTMVTRLELDAYDIGTADVSVAFGRCPISNDFCESLGYLATSGTPGVTVIGIDLPSHETINNHAYSYFLQASLGDSIDTSFASARLTIQPPATPAQSERLSMSAFAFEPWSSTGRTLLHADGPMRFCNGVSCAPIGPVELPSGAWVTRLEMTAYDLASEDILAIFVRCPLGAGSCTQVQSLSTSGMPGFTQVGIDLPAPELIDNENFNYAIQVVLGPDEDTGFFSTGLDVDLVTAFSDGFESGDTTRWSATMP